MSPAGSEEGAGTSAVVLAFLAGLVVGVAGALLLAPRSGAETRERLTSAAGRAGARARRVREGARAAAAAASRTLDEALHRGQPPPP